MQSESLFTDHFPTVQNDAELQQLITKYHYYDSYYVASGSIKERRGYFEELYSLYRPYADRNFLSAVKHDFNGHTWEMYLGVLLLKNGIPIESSDIGPDILIKHKGRKIWIECVACKRGDGIDAVPPMEWNKVQSIPEEEMRIRIASALSEKKKKYEKYMSSGVVGANDAFVIAVNGGMFGYPDYAYPRILQVVFAIGYPTLTFPISGGEPKSGVSRVPFVKKQGGAEVPMTFFLEETSAGISAVIYSNDVVLNLKDASSKEIILVHNKIARNPFPESLFTVLKTYKVDEKGQIKL